MPAYQQTSARLTIALLFAGQSHTNPQRAVLQSGSPQTVFELEELESPSLHYSCSYNHRDSGLRCESLRLELRVDVLELIFANVEYDCERMGDKSTAHGP